MKNLIKTALALSFVSFAACGGSGADAAIAKMGKMADKLCACKDMKCAEGVMKEMSAVKEPSGKPSKAQMDKAMKIAEKMADCQKKLMAADMPPPPPTPPTPPPPTPDMGSAGSGSAMPATGSGSGSAATPPATGSGGSATP
ncbi:MAG TPA: hypothetical protein VHE35_08560 [Kofleriaceae bacterium]|nr:hypothetical protein [Kofleriaceae bacterium]